MGYFFTPFLSPRFDGPGIRTESIFINYVYEENDATI